MNKPVQTINNLKSDDRTLAVNNICRFIESTTDLNFTDLNIPPNYFIILQLDYYYFE